MRGFFSTGKRHQQNKDTEEPSFLLWYEQTLAVKKLISKADLFKPLQARHEENYRNCLFAEQTQCLSMFTTSFNGSFHSLKGITSLTPRSYLWAGKTSLKNIKEVFMKINKWSASTLIFSEFNKVVNRSLSITFVY